MSATDASVKLGSAIASVYAGALEEFVRRRDALARELRSSGDRESAAVVKALRKPSRMAWSLNLGALDPSRPIEPLIASVDQLIEAQSAGADVRGALGGLRRAVREFAGHAADASERAGQSIDPGSLVNAVLAVLGRPDSFAQLRAGHLVEIPDAGGLDFLSSLPAPQELPSPRQRKTDPAPDGQSSPDAAQLQAEARAAAERAARVLAGARTRSEAAQHALRNAEAKLEAAAERVHHAQAEERMAHAELDRAVMEAEEAAAQLVDAEQMADPARNTHDGTA